MTNPPSGASDCDRRARYDGLDAFRSLSIYGVVLIHFSHVLKPPSSSGLEMIIRLRDCALPIIALTSFFVLTRSLLGTPGRSFREFAAQRFLRLEVPCVVWTGIYWLLWGVLGPLWTGGRASWPPMTLWLSGFYHLWFLQFLFVGSLAAYPLIGAIARALRFRWISAAALVAVAAAYWMWGLPYRYSEAILDWIGCTDPYLRITITQSTVYLKYIPLGIASALAADLIHASYLQPMFRAATAAAALGALVLHVTAAMAGVSRALYSLAFFVALLRPWPRDAFDRVRPVSTYSYPIYILHPAAAQAVLAAFALGRVHPSLPTLAVGSLLTFAVSGIAAVVLRTLVPGEWFLPLVQMRTAPAGRERQ